jgi:hypothetical protein
MRMSWLIPFNSPSADRALKRAALELTPKDRKSDELEKVLRNALNRYRGRHGYPPLIVKSKSLRRRPMLHESREEGRKAVEEWVEKRFSGLRETSKEQLSRSVPAGTPEGILGTEETFNA